MKSLSAVSFVLVLTILPGPNASGEVEGTLSSGLELHQPREDVSPEELDVYTAYEEARRLEAEIVQMYREIRAAELTRVQRQTLKRSLESTLMPLSKRAEVDEEILTQKADSAKAVQKYQDELAVVMQETDAIVANARNLLKSLQPEPTEQQSKSKPIREAPEEEAPPEEKREQESSEKQETPEEQKAREEMEAQQKQDRAKAEWEKAEKALMEEAAKEMEKTEEHLKEALKAIKEAKEKVKEESKQTEKAIQEKEQKKQTEQPEQATREEKEKLEKLNELSKKIEKAEEKIGEVVEKFEQKKEVAKEKVEEAETLAREILKALSTTKEADYSASEKEKESQSKQHTSKALKEMQSASESMSKATDALKAAEALGGGGGGGGGDSSSNNNDIARQQALGELAKASSGWWVDLTPQMRGEELAATPSEVPEAKRPQIWASIEELEQAPVARKFPAPIQTDDAWIFIGDWYVLSRYDNEGRANIQKVYPPESVLDLNAQYLSEDGKTLKWEYESYAPPMVAPHGWESWKIYYFYTELYFEEETEAWLAIGSDDRSDLWVNDLPVWYSANRHKGWNPAEGFRKVVFKPGRNKVLLRLENGQQGLGFSIYLNFSTSNP